MRSSARIWAYMPRMMDPELLKRITVQRETLLDVIVSRMTRSMTSKDKHHLLLVGPWGVGKTHLIALAIAALRSDPKLTKAMRIAWLGENEVFSGFLHFAFAIAKALADAYPDEFPEDIPSRVRGLPPDDAALAVLRVVLEHLKQRHLLLVTENLDRTFESLGESGQRNLRAFLQETRRIATLSSAQRLFASVSSRDAVFFGFFEPLHLPPFTVEGVSQLMRHVAVERGQSQVLGVLDTSVGQDRILGLHHLAGGNPRGIILLCHRLEHHRLEDLVTVCEGLADSMIPAFQARMQSLPDQQRQLLQSLGSAPGAMTVKELSSATFIAERNCSKQLWHLREQHFVRSERRGKESYYDVAEPWMRWCLEVQNGRGGPQLRLARFIQEWFDRGDALPNASTARRALPKGDANPFAIGAPSAHQGNPAELLTRVLQRGPSEWAHAVDAIVKSHIEHGAAHRLGKGLVLSIAVLAEGDFSVSQRRLWWQVWHDAGKDCEAFDIPLRCLEVALEVLQSARRSDRPLFRLPLEVRTLIRTLLGNELGDS